MTGSTALAIRCPILCRFLAKFAGVAVFFKLWIITRGRARDIATPFGRAVLQIVLEGAIVLVTGILIGAA